MTGVHIEGMGVPGCFIAWYLDSLGVEFTWSDIDSPATSWKACTGIVYPSGNDVEYASFERWAEWVDDRSAPWPDALYEWVEHSDMMFNHSSPPHGAPVEFGPVDGGAGLSRADPGAYHYNAQEFVPATREAFAEARVEACPAGSVPVQTHGFEPNPRNDGYLWGWTAYVEVSTPESHSIDDRRPYYYLRKNRWQFAYVTPIPGTPFWYAGSDLISQDRIKEYEIAPKFDSWMAFVSEATGGGVEVRSAQNFLHGWRPKERADLSQSWFVDHADGLSLRPLRGNGVRVAPAYCAALVHELSVLGAYDGPLPDLIEGDHIGVLQAERMEEAGG